MDDIQIIQAIDRYREKLSESLQPQKIATPGKPTQLDALRHVLYMLDQIEALLQSGEREKMMRWFGFAQGVLWEEGIYTLDELKDHNR